MFAFGMLLEFYAILFEIFLLSQLVVENFSRACSETRKKQEVTLIGVKMFTFSSRLNKRRDNQL